MNTSDYSCCNQQCGARITRATAHQSAYCSKACHDIYVRRFDRPPNAHQRLAARRRRQEGADD